MSDLISVAIVGTGQLPDASRDLTHGPADDLVARLASSDRERSFLLRAGTHAVLRRGARNAEQRAPSLTRAPTETLPLSRPRLSELLTTLMTDGPPEILEEALERMAKCGVRLTPELLPLALSQTSTEVRGRLRPVLGARGPWLAAHRPEWSWAREASAMDEVLPPDFDQRWAEGTAPERRALLALARRLSEDRGRALVSGSWKQEKAEQRLAWLEVLEAGLSPDDETLLTGMLDDRSSQVRVAAARLCWRIGGSAVAQRIRERATAYLTFKPAAGGLLGKLKAAVLSAPPGALEVTLPPEAFDPDWEREGIVQGPPQGVGRRQWWLQQMLSAVPPDHWAQHFNTTPAKLVEATLAHDLAGVLLDGFSAATIRHESSAWIAPLWDGWLRSEVSPTTHGVLPALAARLSPDEAEERGLALLDRDDGGALLTFFPRPWSARLSQAVLARLERVRPQWNELVQVAALAISVELLPDIVPTPEIAETDYAGRTYVRALERFQTLSMLRRSIAKETPL